MELPLLTSNFLTLLSWWLMISRQTGSRYSPTLHSNWFTSQNNLTDFLVCLALIFELLGWVASWNETELDHKRPTFALSFIFILSPPADCACPADAFSHSLSLSRCGTCERWKYIPRAVILGSFWHEVGSFFDQLIKFYSSNGPI